MRIINIGDGMERYSKINILLAVIAWGITIPLMILKNMDIITWSWWVVSSPLITVAVIKLIKSLMPK